MSALLGLLPGWGDNGGSQRSAATRGSAGAFAGCPPPAGALGVLPTSLGVWARPLLSPSRVTLLSSRAGSCLRVVAFRGGGAGFPPSPPAPAAVPVLRTVPGHATLPLPQFPPPFHLFWPAFGCWRVLLCQGAPMGLLVMGLRPELAPTPLGRHPPPTQGTLWVPGAGSCPWGGVPGSASYPWAPDLPTRAYK